MTTAEQTPTADYRFKAEVKQLLQILVHSLYKEQDIFLRELISNASDALTRLHFEMLTNRDVLDPDAELAIRIEVPEVGEDEPKKIIIKDSGIGMTKEELITNLGTIAQSGAREFLSKLDENSEMDPSEVIGQFGVGFYSVFMVADEVRVVSRSYKKRAKAAAWVSDGSDEFRIEPAEKEDRGTEMHITLKKDAYDQCGHYGILLRTRTMGPPPAAGLTSKGTRWAPYVKLPVIVNINISDCCVMDYMIMKTAV